MGIGTAVSVSAATAAAAAAAKAFFDAGADGTEEGEEGGEAGADDAEFGFETDPDGGVDDGPCVGGWGVSSRGVADGVGVKGGWGGGCLQVRSATSIRMRRGMRMVPAMQTLGAEGEKC